MTNIHINTDDMRQLAGSLEWWSNNLRDGMIPAVNGLKGRLEGDWQGVSRQRYEQILQDWNSHSQSLISSAEELGQHLMATANQFDSVDNS